MILIYCALTLFGTYLIYTDVEDSGCDPTGVVPGNEECESSGRTVLGAMLGIAFAGQGVSQISSALGAFASARVATFEALKAIKRTRGAKGKTIYSDEANEANPKAT